MPRFGFDVVDGDGHVCERRSDLARHGFRGAATPLIDTLLGWERREDWAHGLHPEVGAGAFEPRARLADLAREGIEAAVHYPSPLLGVSDFPDPAQSAAACRAYNDWFAATHHAADPQRLHAAALVPLRDPAAAAAEAKRALHELGAAAVMVQPYVGDDVHLCDPPLDALWSVLQDAGRPVAIHGSRHTCPPHLRPESFRNHARFYALSHPFQQQVAMGDLALGGVLERFPRLKVVFLEAGVGWMPSYIDRLDEAYASVREDWSDDRFVLERAPSEYLLSGNCFFSCEPDEPNLELMVGSLGEEQVIFASDYPHFDCKFPRSAEILLGALPERLARKIAGANPRRLYAL